MIGKPLLLACAVVDLPPFSHATYSPILWSVIVKVKTEMMNDEGLRVSITFRMTSYSL